MGSKARLAKYIVPILQNLIDANGIDVYIEPFVGGANIIDKIRCAKRLGYDIHNGLISIYKSVQQGWIPPLHIDEVDYTNAKAGVYHDPLGAYIGFNGSYGSKYFGGYARGFKADGVTPRDIYNERTRNFLKQIPLLQGITFDTSSFAYLYPKGALIYCDPPYSGTQTYTGTGKFFHQHFWSWVRIVSQTNIVIVSELEAPDGFTCIWQKERSSSLDKNTGGKKAVEKLFVLASSSSGLGQNSLTV